MSNTSSAGRAVKTGLHLAVVVHVAVDGANGSIFWDDSLRHKPKCSTRKDKSSQGQ